MKKIILWYLLLTKRLLKKPVFIVVLVMVPLLVLALGMVSKEDSGVLTVALAQENKDDGLSSEIVNSLLSEHKLIRYIDCENPDEAERLVREGEANSAWIFANNLQIKVDEFVNDVSKKNCFVRVVEREQTVPLLLAHEKLSGVLYKHCSKSLYIQFARENVSELDAMSDDKLMKYYDEIHVDGNLFEYLLIDSEESTEKITNTSYLVTPIRGVLAVLIILCGLATAMFFMQDENKGTFAWVSFRARPFMAFGYHLTSIILISFVVVISIFITGISVFVAREILIMILYAICATLFCMIVRLLCKDIKILSTCVPIIVIGLIAVCPVFFDLNFLRPVQFALPTYYYLNCVYDNTFIMYTVIYMAILTAVYALLCRILKRI